MIALKAYNKNKSFKKYFTILYTNYNHCNNILHLLKLN